MEAPKIIPWIAIVGNPEAGQEKVYHKTGLSLHFQATDCEVNLLAGVHSLFANSDEEKAVWRLLSGQEKVMPRAFILVARAGRLEQDLYLTSQLLDLGLPAILVLTEMKLATDNGFTFNLTELSRALGIPVALEHDLNEERVLKLLSKSDSGKNKRELHWHPSQLLAKSYNNLDEGWISKHLRHLPAGLRLIEGLRLITHPPAVRDYQSHPAEDRLKDKLNQIQNEMMAGGENPSTAEIFQRHAWLRQILSKVVKKDGKITAKVKATNQLASTNKKTGWIILVVGLILAGGSLAWFLIQ